MCNFRERKPTDKENQYLTTGYKVFRVDAATGEIKSVYMDYVFPSDGSWTETPVAENSAIPQVRESYKNPPQTGFHVIIKEVNGRKFFEFVKNNEKYHIRKENGKYHYELRKVEVAGIVAVGKISPCTNGSEIYMGDRRSMIRCRKIRVLEAIDSYTLPKEEIY